MATTGRIYGAIEAGGTKFVCATAVGPGDLRAEARIDTTTPEETIGRVIDFFRGLPEPVASIGIGSFGPVDPDPASATYGFITNTPKSGWQNVDLAGMLRRALRLPVGFDSDVNAAALGERRWGAGRGLDTFIYLTVGTGIGGGGIIAGRPMHGLIHPEMGHVRVPHDVATDPFPGSCPYHGDCLEGLASGQALQKRWGQPAETLPAGHPAWPLEARYLALGIANLIVTLSPQRIIIGGGVMAQPGLLAMVRREVVELLAGYVDAPQVTRRIDDYIVPPALGDRAGVLGAIVLAEQAAE